MGVSVSSLWLDLPSDMVSRLERTVAAAIDRAGSARPVTIFFRADDVAVPGNSFDRLMALFLAHQLPLSLAVVPAWVTPARWADLRKSGAGERALWCWHQHGWRHVNHEPAGKKSEFGASRSREDITADLEKGRYRLQILLGPDFYPAFTPPWNRCDVTTLQQLKDLEYHAVSRSRGSCCPPPDGLPDIPVNVDLHTRKEIRSEQGWENLLGEIHQAISCGFCGIMIHHQRMNNAAFYFLKHLCRIISTRRELLAMHLKDLA
ncbi:MAG: polysaccharide deacetylase family protein [Desulfobacterales bacterium]|nr:polysaccharide deacetylase family protein [Desulfobacterales bacterium]